MQRAAAAGAPSHQQAHSTRARAHSSPRSPALRTLRSESAPAQRPTRPAVTPVRERPLAKAVVEVEVDLSNQPTDRIGRTSAFAPSNAHHRVAVSQMTPLEPRSQSARRSHRSHSPHSSSALRRHHNTPPQHSASPTKPLSLLAQREMLARLASPIVRTQGHAAPTPSTARRSQSAPRARPTTLAHPSSMHDPVGTVSPVRFTPCAPSSVSGLRLLRSPQ